MVELLVEAEIEFESRIELEFELVAVEFAVGTVSALASGTVSALASGTVSALASAESFEVEFEIGPEGLMETYVSHCLQELLWIELALQ